VDRPECFARTGTTDFEQAHYPTAECLGVCTRTVRRWIKKGLLVAHRFNGLVRIPEADFQAFHRRPQ
jgi:excisionase family DNA binding protein